MFLLILALAVLLGVASLSWTALLRLTSRTAWLMALYLIASANVILAGYISGGLHMMDRPWLILSLHLASGGVGWLIWSRTGKPALWPPMNFDEKKKIDLILLFFLAGVILAYIFVLAQVIFIPQNNVDSLSTHLSRIAYWRQFGSYLPWPTFLINQVTYPLNVQMLTYWTLLFLGGDQLVGIVQWLGAIFTAIGVFGLATLFGYDRRQSTFAALFFLTFPLIALQASTTQTDLVTTVFFILPVYFLFLGLREGKEPVLMLSAIGVGIGVGAKKSYLLLLPILLIMAWLAFKHFRPHYRSLKIWFVSLMVSILLFGAYGYILNWSHYGSVFGPPGYFETLIDVPEVPVDGAGMRDVMKRARRMMVFDLDQPSQMLTGGILGELIYNLPRLAYQALDTSGLPRPLDGYAHKAKTEVARAFFQFINFEDIEGAAYTAPGHAFDLSAKNTNEESEAWYGPLSVLLLFPAIVIQTWRGIRKHNLLLLCPVFALITFTPLEIILRPGWDPYQGRYFMPLVALTIPFIGGMVRPEISERRRVADLLLSGVALLLLYVTILYNPSKPTLGKFADEFDVWRNDRVFIQTIQRKKERILYYEVEKRIPPDVTVGFFNPGYFLDYPLFGSNLTRHVIPLTTRRQINDLAWLREQKIEYILVSNEESMPIPPAEYELVVTLQFWKMFEYHK